MSKNRSLSMVVASLFLATLWGCGSNMDSGGDQTSGATPEELRASATFVGSTKCLSCHGDKENWGHTLHKTVLRKPGEFSKPQGKSEAFYAGTINKGLELLTGGKEIFYFNIGGAWHASQTNDPAQAANLKFKAGINKSGTSYILTLTDLAGTSGVKTYPVLLTYGGEANYKQRYVVTIGNSKYISPLQYNDKGVDADPTTFATSDSLWVPYNAPDWYTAASNTLKVPALAKAFDGNCAGCHFTGYSVTKNSVTGEEMADAVNDPNGALDFDGDGALDEINVGCEACHGAGSVHATTSNPAYIVNPANLSPEKANMVCGQCHIRGVTKDDFSALTARAKLEFPAKIDADGKLQKFRPGDDINDYYEWISTASQYWGNKVPGDGFVASKQHHQQYIDMLQGGHAAITCAACHESHDNASPSRVQVRTSRVRDGVTIVTATADNTLCLSCHAGVGIFASVPVADVAKVRTNGPSAALAAAVEAHTGHGYDPTGSGASRCVDCHMPYTAKTALNYDIRAHSFQTIQPKHSLSTAPTKDVPNSCGSCHTKGLNETSDAWANRLQGYFNTLFAGGPLASVSANDFVGTEACKTCHFETYRNFKVSGHNFKLSKVVDKQMPTFPFSTIADKLQEVADPAVAGDLDGLTDNLPGDPRAMFASYADVSYVIGGYGWKSRWIDNKGYVITGSKAQYNLENNSWSAYNNNLVIKYDYSCNYCHTTGARVGSTATKAGTFNDNFSPALPGFDGDGFVMPGIQCESCHGAGLKHINSLSAADITRVATPRSAASLLSNNAYGQAVTCAECHTRDNERLVKYTAGVLDTTKSFKSYFELRRYPAELAAFRAAGFSTEATGLIISNSHGRTSHHEMNEELQGIDPLNVGVGPQGAHRNLACNVCHNPHQTLKQSAKAGTSPMRQSCEGCHPAFVNNFSPAAALMAGKVDCVSCHMPDLVQNAISVTKNGWTFGDDRSHSMKIDLSKSALPIGGVNGQNVLIPDADGVSRWYAYPHITREFACRACHTADHVDAGNWSTFKVHN